MRHEVKMSVHASGAPGYIREQLLRIGRHDPIERLDIARSLAEHRQIKLGEIETSTAAACLDFERLKDIAVGLGDDLHAHVLACLSCGMTPAITFGLMAILPMR